MSIERPADIEGINKVLTNALVLFALNNPNPDEPALKIKGKELTPGDLVREVGGRTRIG